MNRFYSLLDFDPTESNHFIDDGKHCKECGCKDFETYKEGDFRDITYVEVCKNCKTVKK
jgi:hypothetical protein